MHLGEHALNEEDVERARGYFEESLEYGASSHATLWVSMALNGLGWVALARRDYAQACTHFQDACRWAITTRLIRPATLALAGLASALGTSPETTAEGLVRAAALWGAAEAIREEARLPFSAGDRLRIDKYMIAARTRLAAQAWEMAVAQGHGLTLEQACNLALTHV